MAEGAGAMEVGVGIGAGCAWCVGLWLPTPLLTSPLEGGRDELVDGRGCRVGGSCLRRNDGGGRRSDGGGAGTTEGAQE